MVYMCCSAGLKIVSGRGRRTRGGTNKLGTGAKCWCDAVMLGECTNGRWVKARKGEQSPTPCEDAKVFRLAYLGTEMLLQSEASDKERKARSAMNLEYGCKD